MIAGIFNDIGFAFDELDDVFCAALHASFEDCILLASERDELVEIFPLTF